MDILQQFIHYFPQALTLSNILVLIVGTILGLVLGALPGLSPTMAVALLVPFTFVMTPSTGLTLLGAVYVCAMAGGAISAILINVPGAPANIATLFDGYPMSKQGKSQEALNMCFISSLIGGLFGMVAMIFFTPPLAEIALKFGPSEMFWVAVVGVTCMAGLSTGSLIKGLIGGSFGLWMATIGFSPLLGEPRFIFSNVLEGGINMVAALIGLFALPQMLTLLEGIDEQKTFKEKLKPQKGILKKNIIEVLKMRKTLSIGSIVGTVIGVIPGAGGQVAGLIAYDQTKRFSKDQSRFGNGDPRGVVAAETANKAMAGPSLIPLLTLSIPGSPTAAVLLGGLLIHGLFPGPELFQEHADIVYIFMASLVLAQFSMTIFGILMARYSYGIMNLPKRYIIAGVIILSVFGSYSIQNNFNDILICFGIGFVQYLFQKVGIKGGPVVLGLILGGIAENNLSKAMLICQGTGESYWHYFGTGPINITLILISVFSIAYSLYSTAKTALRTSTSESALTRSSIRLGKAQLTEERK
jgi:putative tricarboxylic transport membrane protein